MVRGHRDPLVAVLGQRLRGEDVAVLALAVLHHAISTVVERLELGAAAVVQRCGFGSFEVGVAGHNHRLAIGNWLVAGRLALNQVDGWMDRSID